MSPILMGEAMAHAKRERTTRRLFCRRLAGFAVTGAFVCLESTAVPKPRGSVVDEADNREVPGNVEHLVAVCGTYCGACPMYINNQTDDKQKVKGM
jgi:tRNA G37 N-methylase TrmD